MTSRSFGVLAGLAPILVAVAAQGQPGRSAPGWTVAVNIITDFGDRGRGDTTAMRLRITENRLRWELTRVAKPSGPVHLDDAYTIVDIEDSTMTSVTPAQHMATIVSLNPLGARRASLKLTTAEHLTRSDLEDLGDGGRILGHATRRYRLTTQGSSEMTAMGQTCSHRIDTVMEMWIARDVDLGPMAGAMRAHLGIGMTAATPSSMSGVTPAALPKGSSLRTIIRQPELSAGGRGIAVTTTIEAVELTHASIDATVFSRPVDIPTTDLRERMAQLPAAMFDSAVQRGASFMSTPAGKAMCGSGGR